MTSEMVLKTARLQFYSMIYSRENKHKSGYSIKERSSGYKGRQ